MLRKEEEVRSKDNRKKTERCRFYERGFCRYSEEDCKALHIDPPVCRYQLQCPYWPNCKFVHTNTAPNKPCRYQENCRNFYCNFEHYGQSGDNYFLGENLNVPDFNFQNFPPLNHQNFHPARSQMQNPWRPW